jgi:hypothetical protein
VRRTWEEELRFDDDVVRAGEMGLQAEYADQTPECVHPCSDIQRDLIACRERIILECDYFHPSVGSDETTQRGTG